MSHPLRSRDVVKSEDSLLPGKLSNAHTAYIQTVLYLLSSAVFIVDSGLRQSPTKLVKNAHKSIV